MIKYDNKIILLSQVSKIKILTSKISNIDFINILIDKIESISQENAINTKQQNRENYNSISINNSKLIENNIDNNIKTIGYEGINEKIIQNNSYKEVLGNKTKLIINRDLVVDGVDIKIENIDVVSDIHQSIKKVISEVDVLSKQVLTENAETIDVAKPIQTSDVNVITDIEIDDYNLLLNQESISAITKLKESRSQVITDINSKKIDSAIVNIDKEKQIIKTKTIEIVELKPINNYISKKDINLRALRIDPTGDGYVGVVLDDGTFEPLKICTRKMKVIDEEVDSILCNIDTERQIKSVVESIDNITKKEFVDSIEIVGKEDVVKYEKDNFVKSKDIITYSNRKINNIINSNDTVSVVTKDKLEYINTVSQISESEINCISDISKDSIIKSIEPEINKKEVVKDVELEIDNLHVLNLDEDIVTKIKKEKVEGEILGVGSGIVLVKNENLDISIYSTSKINSIN